MKRLLNIFILLSLSATTVFAQTQLSVDLTNRQQQILSRMLAKENQDRVDRGAPETRFCDDDPTVCSQPSMSKLLNDRVNSLLNSFQGNQDRVKGNSIGAFCTRNPENANCVALEGQVE